MIRIQESLPSFISKFKNKYDRNFIVNILSGAGTDLNNLKYDRITFAKPSDPRFRGINGALFYIIGDNCVAYINKEWRSSSWKLSDDKEGVWNSEIFRRLPIKKKIDAADEVYFVPYEYDQTVRDKRAQRRDSKKGSVDRYTYKTKPRYKTIDKSGYIIDPGKYQRMLAEMNIDNVDKILTEVAEIYSKLALALPSVDTDNYILMSDYSSIMQRIPSEFRDLDRVMKDYNNHKNHEDNPIKKSEYEYYKGVLVKHISNIRAIVREGNKLVSRIQSSIIFGEEE